jgi:hypothetical protein
MEFSPKPAQPPVEVSRSEGSDIAVKTSLLLYIAFAVSLGIIGLLASCFLFASPAYRVINQDIVGRLQVIIQELTTWSS